MCGRNTPRTPPAVVCVIFLACQGHPARPLTLHAPCIPRPLHSKVLCINWCKLIICYDTPPSKPAAIQCLLCCGGCMLRAKFEVYKTLCVFVCVCVCVCVCVSMCMYVSLYIYDIGTYMCVSTPHASKCLSPATASPVIPPPHTHLAIFIYKHVQHLSKFATF